MNHEALKEKILHKLKERNFSVSNTEKLAGLGRGCLWSFLSGRTKSPTIDTLHAVSKVLDYDLGEMLDIYPLISNEETQIPFNISLYFSVIELTKRFFLEHKIPLKNVVFLNLVKEIYYFCLTKKAETLDVEFANWYLEIELKKKSSKTLGQSDFL